jgi:hypothetical protein
MAAILAAFHFADSIVVLAPEVGLEPTTLRLTASEFPSPSTAIVCCKSLYKSKLENPVSTVHCYRYCLIATDFERAWAQKWVQSFQSLLDRFYKTLQIENASHISRYWNEASPEKAGVGGSIPSLATI